MLETTDQIDVEQFVAALRRDHSKLSLRIREVLHSVRCECEGVTLRTHYPTLVQGRATIWELIEALLDYLTPFATHRASLLDLEREYRTLSAEEYRKRCERLQRTAVDVFVRAQKLANKNGEVGELLLFVLTEWILNAPQLLAKLPLKTARNVPVFGTDGIHVGYSAEKNTLYTYWGEAKLYADVGDAIKSAARSIRTALKPDKARFEMSLIVRNVDTIGLSPDAKSLLLSFLNPLEDENYNKRIDVTTCLIGFDFDAYKQLNAGTTEARFADLVRQKMGELAPALSNALKSVGVRSQRIELFLFPVPSTQDLRDQFQSRIGWNHDSGTC